MADGYIKKKDVEALIKRYCHDLIDKGRTRVEVTEFNADIQAKLAEMLEVVMLEYWIPTEWEIPAEEGQVLVLASGKYKNITLDHAVLIANYVDGEWILEQYPEMVDVKVSHWAFIPRLPVGIFEETEDSK